MRLIKHLMDHPQLDHCPYGGHEYCTKKADEREEEARKLALKNRKVKK